MPHYANWTAPQSPWPRPDAILMQKPGRLPRQSYPPQTGCFNLPEDDPLTDYLRMVAHDEMWDEWDYCWSRLAYLPRWNLSAMWECPPGWLTPHAFLSWACWHMAVAYQWIRRLWRATQRTHSPEQLLSSSVAVNPIYMFLNTNQLGFVKKRLGHMLIVVHAGDQMHRPTNEKVVYPPDGLATFLDYIKAFDLERCTVEWQWHESRAKHRAEFFVRELDTLTAAATTLKQHLGEAGWSE